MYNQVGGIYGNSNGKPKSNSLLQVVWPPWFRSRAHSNIQTGLRAPAMNFRHSLCACLLPLLLAAGVAFADELPEDQLKSEFIYNFSTFVDWPDRMGKSLTLCVAAPQAEMKYFSALEGEPVGNMKVAVRHLDRGASAKTCHILFVSESESDGFSDWLPEVEGKHVLTVSESEKWLKKGVMVSLMFRENKIVFDVNIAAASEAGVVINSRLLRLARKVYGMESADDPADKIAK